MALWWTGELSSPWRRRFLVEDEDKASSRRLFFFFLFFSFITLLVDRSSQIINLFWLLSEAVKFFCFWFFLERPKRSKVRAKGFPEIHNLLKRSVQR